MKIALIAHGDLTIPPRGWGAVENVVWNHKIRLEMRGHRVDVYNSRSIHEVVYAINQERYDFVHCHCELYARACYRHLEPPYALTWHSGWLHDHTRSASLPGSVEYLFRDTLLAPANLVLTEMIRGLYVARGYGGFLRVHANGVETESFRMAREGNGRSICVGRICRRKRQAALADMTRGRLEIDFVGPWNKTTDPEFRLGGTSRYLGGWDKPTLYEQLTNYSCFILLSASEAAPLVVLEALAAGLSVVISEASAAHLTPQPFITVLPVAENRPEVVCGAIRNAVEQNTRQREAIRAYALDHFDYPKVIDNYLATIQEYLDGGSSVSSVSALVGAAADARSVKAPE